MFPETLGVPRQEVLEVSAARPPLRVAKIDADDLSEALRSAAARGFDLSHEPPLRAHLFALNGQDERTSQGRETEHVLLLLLHHIAGDGSSLAPLARDLAQRLCGTPGRDGAGRRERLAAAAGAVCRLHALAA